MKQIIAPAILILTFCFTVFTQTLENPCPAVEISTRNELARINETMFFIAEVGKEIDRYDIKYNWKTQNVEILEGQGTRLIAGLKKTNNGGIITLEITGLPENCANTFTQSISIVCFATSEQIDEFGTIPNGELKARLDNFLLELQNNPTGKGLVVISDDQKSLSLLKLYDNHFGFRGFDRTRISFLITNKTTAKTQLYFIPAGVDDLNFEDGLVIKATDYQKLENLFLTKPTIKKRKK